MSRATQRAGSMLILLFMALLGLFSVGCYQYSNAKLSLLQIEVTELSGLNKDQIEKIKNDR